MHFSAFLKHLSRHYCSRGSIHGKTLVCPFQPRRGLRGLKYAVGSTPWLKAALCWSIVRQGLLPQGNSIRVWQRLAIERSEMNPELLIFVGSGGRDRTGDFGVMNPFNH